MAQTQIIEIPLPPVHCKSNGPHLHWAAKAKARKQYRTEAWAAAKEQHAMPLHGPVTLSVAAFMARKANDGRYRPTDRDGLIGALKGAIDGAVDAGVISDDNKKILSWGEIQIYSTAKQHGGRSCVVLTFTQDEA